MQQRKLFSVVMALGALPLVAALSIWPLNPRRAAIFLLPVAVYLVCRYARPGVVVKLLAVGLLALAGLWFFGAEPRSDPLFWAEVAAIGLCGIGLLLGIRWAAFIWCGLVVALLTVFRQQVTHGLSRGGNGMWDVLAMGLFVWVVGVGGSIAIAFNARAAKTGRLSSLVAGSQGSRVFAFACLIAVVLVFVQWFATRIPDPEGFAQLHPSIMAMPPVARESSHAEPFCNKISYCGRYVEVSCLAKSVGQYFLFVYYYDNVDGMLIMECGDDCSRGPLNKTPKRCSACPPPEWGQCTASGASAPR